MGKYTSVDDYYVNKGVIKGEFRFKLMTESEILKHLKKVNINKATGLDQLPARFLRDGADVIVPAFTHIVNLSIRLGKVPSDMKGARVVPLHKKNSTLEVGNYRPVSILSVASKILEKVAYDQLIEYLNNKRLIYNLQSGFRPSFSTDSCLMYLNDTIRREIDHGNFVGMILIDLQKAFDTVNHSILLHKLSAMGVHDSSLQWFDSYLVNRTQVVDVGGTISEPNPISCEVPQGSILGPLLFLCYVNDMEQSVSCELLLYADDSALIISHKNVVQIETRLGQELSLLSEWLIDNRLSLHLGKTESILFASKGKVKKLSNLDITCNNVSISAQPNVNYLGAKIQQNMSGENMAEAVVKKVSSKLKYLYRQCKGFNKETKKQLANALIMAHFDYASSSWYSPLSKTTKKTLQIAQNKVIRFVLGLKPRTHIEFDHFNKLSWLPVSVRVEQLKLSHMFKIITGTAPEYMQKLNLIKEVHSHNTRYSLLNIHVPNIGTMGLNSFSYTGILAWNALPSSIKSINDINSFKREVKKYLTERYKKDCSNAFIYY